MIPKKRIVPLRIGILHYACPPVVGGVEEVLSRQADTFHRLGHSVFVLAGMGEVYSHDFPVRIEPLLGSQVPEILRAHEQAAQGNPGRLREPVNRLFEILSSWSEDLDVILAHNVLHMPFNLPLTLGLRRLASTGSAAAVVSWAHDSPYLDPNYPKHLDRLPWAVLRRPHKRIHHVTISKSRKKAFERHLDHVAWQVLPNGIDPVRFFYLDAKTEKLADELDLFHRDMVVVQPSRITPRKNLELSIHIIRGIKLLGYNILFLLTGAYDPHEERAVAYYRRLRYWMKELGLEKNIAILAEYTFQDGEKLVPDRVFIRDLYLIADLLLMTSKDEGFGLPLLEAGMIKLPVACSEIPAFEKLGRGVCFFRLDEPPLFIAGRIIEYLGRTNTHKMFRHVMGKYIWDVICRREVMPFLLRITGKGRTEERHDPVV
jgi:glycosyltransferase involved in cell wall biosynthesis